MKFYLDTEFLEEPGSIDLISIGIVAETGETLYLENLDFELSRLDGNDWMQKNVVPGLKYLGKFEDETMSVTSLDLTGFAYHADIGLHIQRWIRIVQKEHFDYSQEIQFRAYYADYDWVVFAWLYGKMIDLPKEFPMYCYDLKQKLVDLNLTSDWVKQNVPQDEGAEHNALEDAKWNIQLDIALDKTKDIKKEKPYVFLGGTCAGFTKPREGWRGVLQDRFDDRFDFFDPVVENWTEDDIRKENEAKEKASVLIYYIDFQIMKGVYSIAEVIDSCYQAQKIDEKEVIFVVDIDKLKDYPHLDGERKSFEAVGKLVEQIGGTFHKSFDELLHHFS